MAYFWADDFIKFLENEKILSFKLSNFWELLTNEQFLNLVESYEKRNLCNATTIQGLKQLYNILYKQKIKIRDIAFSCSNKDILECLRLYIRFFDKNKSKLKFQSLTVNSVPQKVDHLSINPKQDVENNIKNTSKFASALERLKSIAKEKQVLKHESENIPEDIDNQINSQFDAPKLEVKEENKKEPKEEDIKEKKPKVKILTFDENFYNYLLKKYNSEDEALNLLFGYKLYEIFNKRYNAMNPYKKIDYKEDIEFQEFNDDNFGIPKKSLFDYLAFKKILSENKEKENIDNNEQKKTENKSVKIMEEKVESTEALGTENKSVEIVEEKVESTEPVRTEFMELREDVSDKFSLQDVDEIFLNNCESLLPTKFYFYDEIVEVKNWKELYISIAKQFAEKFHENLFSKCNAGKGLLYDSILDIGRLADSLIEPVQICDDLFLMTADKFNRNVKTYLRKIKKLAEICEADFEKIIIYFL